MLGNAEPTNNIVKMLFARDQDEIVISTLCNWCRKKKDIHQKLVDALVFTMTTVNFTIFNGKFEAKILICVGEAKSTTEIVTSVG